MSEVKIKNTTIEEFKTEFKLNNIEGIANYSVSELASLMGRANGKTYYVIGDRLFEEPSYEIGVKEVSKDDISEIEKLHDDYRDLLVEYREFLFYRRGDKDSEEAIKIKKAMNNTIMRTRELLEKNGINAVEDLKKASTKFFIPDFTNDVFRIDNFNMIDEIDCGL